MSVYDITLTFRVRGLHDMNDARRVGEYLLDYASDCSYGRAGEVERVVFIDDEEEEDEW